MCRHCHVLFSYFKSWVVGHAHNTDTHAQTSTLCCCFLHTKRRDNIDLSVYPAPRGASNRTGPTVRLPAISQKMIENCQPCIKETLHLTFWLQLEISWMILLISQLSACLLSVCSDIYNYVETDGEPKISWQTMILQIRMLLQRSYKLSNVDDSHTSSAWKIYIVRRVSRWAVKISVINSVSDQLWSLVTIFPFMVLDSGHVLQWNCEFPVKSTFGIQNVITIKIFVWIDVKFSVSILGLWTWCLWRQSRNKLWIVLLAFCHLPVY